MSLALAARVPRHLCGRVWPALELTLDVAQEAPRILAVSIVRRLLDFFSGLLDELAQHVVLLAGLRFLRGKLGIARDPYNVRATKSLGRVCSFLRSHAPTVGFNR